MAQYKVPQDVEADDKLIGPFSFRQFVYLLVAGGLIALAVALCQLTPLLILVPAPFIILFLVLALPLKKDQPMETYMVAMISYYLKPHIRKWMPGQRDTTIYITAPKVVDDNRTRDISGEEATNRLSFLANLVDSEGYSIKGASNNSMREDLLAEANATADMYENYRAQSLNMAIDRDKQERHDEMIQEMRNAINRREELDTSTAMISNDRGMVREREPVPGAENKPEEKPLTATLNNMTAPTNNQQTNEMVDEMADPLADNSGVVVMPTPASASTVDSTELNVDIKAMRNEEKKNAEEVSDKNEAKEIPEKEEKAEKNPTTPAKPSIMELANNTDFTVATIAKEANRLNRKDEGEVFISLH